MIILKIVAIILCVLVLVVTFKTEYILKSVFRVENPDSKIIMRVKYIAMLIAVVLLIAVLLIIK